MDFSDSGPASESDGIKPLMTTDQIIDNALMFAPGVGGKLDKFFEVIGNIIPGELPSSPDCPECNEDDSDVKNFRGELVQLPEDPVMSPRDPPFSSDPIVERGPFTSKQREAFLSGKSGGMRISPHHRHQTPIAHGGVIDELPGPRHPSGNQHT